MRALRYRWRTGAVLAALLASTLPAQTDARESTIPVDALDALDRWLVDYRARRITLSGRRVVDDSMAVALGLVGRTHAPVSTVDELEALVAGATEQGGPGAARRLLALSAVGLDRASYSARMLPTRARLIGEAGLLACEDLATRTYVLDVARGTPTDHGDRAIAVQAAALRALGGYGLPVFRTTLEEKLRAPETRVRLAAAEGLLRMRSPASLASLVNALEGEEQPAVLRTVATAAADLVRGKSDRTAPARMASTALGRTTWRADLALIDLIEACRRPETVPSLIDVLERFVRPGEKEPSGRPSGLLRHRAQRALVSLTGMRHPADRPAEWRYGWSRVSRNFQVPADPPPANEPRGPRLFGLPIHGSRVLFAVDLSGSMEFSFRAKTTRLAVAQDALAEAIQELPEDTSFDVICFSDRTWRWNDPMQRATPKNKRLAIRFVRAMRADGGTNTWGALTEALRLHDRVYGAACHADADELYLISDGIPTVGQVIDAQAILQLVAAGNSLASVHLHTVYLAPRLTRRDQEGERKMGMRARDFMKQLAKQNAGRFSEQF